MCVTVDIDPVKKRILILIMIRVLFFYFFYWQPKCKVQKAPSLAVGVLIRMAWVF